jgi:hypothetical protein
VAGYCFGCKDADPRLRIPVSDEAQISDARQAVDVVSGVERARE